MSPKEPATRVEMTYNPQFGVRACRAVYDGAVLHARSYVVLNKAKRDRGSTVLFESKTPPAIQIDLLSPLITTQLLKVMQKHEIPFETAFAQMQDPICRNCVMYSHCITFLRDNLEHYDRSE